MHVIFGKAIAAIYCAWNRRPNSDDPRQRIVGNYWDIVAMEPGVLVRLGIDSHVAAAVHASIILTHSRERLPSTVRVQYMSGFADHNGNIPDTNVDG